MNGTMHEPLTCAAEAINSLLSSELAAADVYTDVLAIFADDVVISDLQQIRADHRRSVRHLRDCLVSLGAQPVEGGGAWGGFGPGAAHAKAIGPAATLAMLCQSEESAIIAYEEALGRADIHADCLRAIQVELLPACRRHVEELNQLLGGTDR